MTEQVVVLGSGYAGAGAIRSLEDALHGEADVTWISDADYHLVLHESHRCIRDPSVQEKITVPVEEIMGDATTFMQGEVASVDTDERVVHLDGGEDVAYDYLLVGIGSRTAFFGIEGLEEHAHTLKGLDDALGIHEDIGRASREATRTDPAEVVIGGAGLSGIQTAGEIAEYRDDQGAPLSITLVEGLDEIFPGNDDSVQTALRKRLEERDVSIMTGEFIGKVDEETVYIGEDTELDYDVLVWTGGITGRDAVRDMDVDKDERNYRLKAGQTFQTDDERVFAIGDAALIDQNGNDPAPPTAQAAWQAAEVVGENIVRAIRNEPLKRWRFKDKGTVISVGEDAVAHDVYVVPFKDTFGGLPARTLKKAIAARWIRDVAGTGRAASAWSDM
ncbi:MAG: NADH dehydrogenase FAD-containing subunit [Halobacteriales archaeon SW_8_66_22]|jgi:NADH dehydrogenase|nr:MAG: NADH dehydrogenase FAD-containing subunit [Halobacteriales archaeon SW_8_66_22]